MICEKCGKSISDDSAFCLHCGAKVKKNKKAKAKKFSIIKLLIVLPIICTLAILITILSINTKTVTVSEYINSGQTIWYWVRDYVYKDAEVKKIFVMNNDGTLIYTIDEYSNLFNPRYLTLGQLETMNDSEIINMVRENYEAHINDSIDNISKELKGDKKAQNVLEKYRGTAQDAQYVLGLMDGDTKGSRRGEAFFYHESAPITSNDENGKRSYFRNTIGFFIIEDRAKSVFGNCTRIGNSYYGGFATNDGILPQWLVTRMDDNYRFVLDEYGTEGIYDHPNEYVIYDIFPIDEEFSIAINDKDGE